MRPPSPQHFSARLPKLILPSIQNPQATIKSEPSAVSLGKRKMVDPPSDSDIIYISDSDENSHPKLLSTTQSTSSKPKKIWRGNNVLEKKSLNTLDLTLDLDSDPESHISDSKKFTRKRARFSANEIRPPISLKDGIRITKKDWVEVLEHIDEIPLGWDVPRKSTAFLVDLTDNTDFNTEEKSLIAWIRHEVRIFHSFLFLFFTCLFLETGSVFLEWVKWSRER
jgi:hypothetical protein